MEGDGYVTEVQFNGGSKIMLGGHAMLRRWSV